MRHEAEQRMRALLRREIDRGNLPGGMFALWRNGKELFCAIEGMADLERGLPLTRDSLFRLYSMTKPVTAVAAMMLAEAGKLRLEDKVSDYLPEYARMSWLNPAGEVRPCEREITLWNLLTMTSGLVYPDPDPAGQRMQRCFDGFEKDNLAGRGPTTRRLAALAAGQPLAFEPGTAWRYGLSADVLGAIIEIASGQRFSQFLRERIFDPLGMADTGFYVPEEKWERLVQLYKYEDGRLRPDDRRHLGLTLCLTPPTFESGGAGLISTLDDYARFGNMLANRGVANGKRYVSEETIRCFQRGLIDHNAFPELDGTDSLEGYSYGCFMRALQNPAQAGGGSVGEFGWDGWTGPYMSVDAENGVFMLLMMQVGAHRGWPLVKELRQIALSALE